ncbi:3483_t:CDS:1, partial [Dentiscutata heterogama]
KGLFLTWSEKQKEKSIQQNELTTDKNVKNDIANNEINTVEVITFE